MRLRKIEHLLVTVATLMSLGCEGSTPRPSATRRAESVARDAAASTTAPVASVSNVTSAAGFSDAAFREAAMQARARELRRQLGPDFLIRCEWPFVAASNLPAARFDAVFDHSLVGSYKCLCRDYFTSEPDRLITVCLFKDDDTYRRWADELFGDRPDTPFGYYSHRHRALIMNIGTGTGTLVHELCHALIERDFPNYPSWFNEGLASLHEQCEWRDGSLVGLPNWRLPALQKAIASGTALSLKDLMAKTDARSFYEKDKGLNYATARYLCQYVQQRGKLREFYARLKRDIARDPTSEKTLVAVLGLPLDEIEADWRRWVLSLEFSE